MKISPKSEALAFRIWQYATPREWNVTVTEIADHLGEDWRRVGAMMRWRGWLTRVRVTSSSANESGWKLSGAGNVYSGQAVASRHIAADLASGRIENGESV
jgi:uncharacterized membrane protein